MAGDVLARSIGLLVAVSLPAIAQTPLSLYTMTPCRLADTRGNGFSGAFGPPSLVAGAVRTFPVPTGACSLPAGAGAYLMNLTVVPPGPLGYITAWPAGVTQPLAATLNAPAGNVVNSLAIVAAGTAGAINIYASGATDLVIDISGYYLPSPTQPSIQLVTFGQLYANPLLCLSVNGTFAYTCKLPFFALSSWYSTYQAGMMFFLVPDTTCSAACSLVVDGVGSAPVSIKQSDGVTDPGGQIVAGVGTWVWFDGKVFRIL